MPSPINAPSRLNGKLIPRRIIAGAVLGLAIAAKGFAIVTTPVHAAPSLDQPAAHAAAPVPKPAVATRAQQAKLKALIEQALNDQALTIRTTLTAE